MFTLHLSNDHVQFFIFLIFFCYFNCFQLMITSLLFRLDLSSLVLVSVSLLLLLKYPLCDENETVHISSSSFFFKLFGTCTICTYAINIWIRTIKWKVSKFRQNKKNYIYKSVRYVPAIVRPAVVSPPRCNFVSLLSGTVPYSTVPVTNFTATFLFCNVSWVRTYVSNYVFFIVKRNVKRSIK